jgi:hypothetical protein
VGLADPNAVMRLEAWHQLARLHISADVCADLAKHCFPELAHELMRQRGDIE